MNKPNPRCHGCKHFINAGYCKQPDLIQIGQYGRHKPAFRYLNRHPMESCDLHEKVGGKT